MELDSEKLRIAPMSYDECTAFCETAKAMRQRGASDREWAELTFRVVADGLDKAAPMEIWDVARVKRELSYATVNELFEEIIRMSGLGEKPDTPVIRIRLGDTFPYLERGER
jgi:hypothetical protein